jgi:mannose-6-phosphate isomerase-like protein (cupin superfamily)
MSARFVTRELGDEPDAIAPDGSEVRILAATARGSMAHFELPPGHVSNAVAHHTVEELWFITCGQGRFWRKSETAEETVDIHPGVSISIPVGTHFQFRSDGEDPLEAIGVTMPPWPGDDEAYDVTGIWKATS